MRHPLNQRPFQVSRAFGLIAGAIAVAGLALSVILSPLYVMAQNPPLPELPPIDRAKLSQMYTELESPDTTLEPPSRVSQPASPLMSPLVFSRDITPGIPVYKHPYMAIDPTPANNPTAKEFPGYRGANQIVIYTPTSGAKTGTNTFGAEAVIVDGVVQSIECCDSAIPTNGYVVSAHGQAGEWLKKHVQPGMMLSLDPGTHLLMFQNTPSTYLSQAKRQLETVKANAAGKVVNQEAYQAAVAQSESCLANLEQAVANATESITVSILRQIQEQSKECREQADQAYYQTVKNNAGEFRGIWLRPLERTPEQMEKTAQRLKALGIRDIFIETYYQGKTIYPSSVMTDYGLTPQHARFKGSDPLAQWIEIAHRNGMRVHAWMQIFFAGNKDENAEQYGPILNKYPQWTNIERATLCTTTQCNATALDTAGALIPKPSSAEPGHYFVDPANPEVQTYLQKLAKEVVTQYAVDGVNFDYIRYPATMPLQSSRFLQSNWGYTATARKQFIAQMEKEEADKLAKPAQGAEVAPAAKPLAAAKTDPMRFDPIRLTPSHPLWSRWVDWRKEQVSSFLKNTREQLLQARPNLQLTAVVFPLHDPKSQIKLQDWPRWVKEGWLNALTPIGLYPTPEGIFKDSMSFREVTQDKIPVYVGIFGAYNRINPSEFVAQIDAAHQAGMPGIMLFENSRLSEPYREALQQGPFRE